MKSFAIKKIASRPRKKKPVKGTVSYDRRNTVTVVPQGGKRRPEPEEITEDTTVIDVEPSEEEPAEELPNEEEPSEEPADENVEA